MLTKLKSKLKNFLRHKIINLLRPELNRFETKLTEVDDFFFIISQETERLNAVIASNREKIEKYFHIMPETVTRIGGIENHLRLLSAEFNSGIEKNDLALQEQKNSINGIENTLGGLENHLRLLSKEFNSRIEKNDLALQEQKNSIGSLENTISGFEKKINRLPELIQEQRIAIEGLEKHLRLLSEEHNRQTQIQSQIQNFIDYDDNKYQLQNLLEKTPHFDYLQFENQFRGSEEMIKERQQYYLKYFEGCVNVLDIGCGRAEFIELAQKNEIGVTGIDMEANNQIYCRQKGIEIIHGDVFPFLVNNEDNTFDGIFSSQVIEHLPFRRLQQLAHLFYQKVKPGSYIVLETVNPLCPLALQHFYTDLTHEKPLFPKVLRFLFENYKLNYVHTIFSVPIDPNLPAKTLKEELAANYLDYAIVIKKN